MFASAPRKKNPESIVTMLTRERVNVQSEKGLSAKMKPLILSTDYSSQIPEKV